MSARMYSEANMRVLTTLSNAFLAFNTLLVFFTSFVHSSCFCYKDVVHVCYLRKCAGCFFVCLFYIMMDSQPIVCADADARLCACTCVDLLEGVHPSFISQTLRGGL